MTQKLTQADIENRAKKRNHILISLSNPENPLTQAELGSPSTALLCLEMEIKEK